MPWIDLGMFGGKMWRNEDGSFSSGPPTSTPTTTNQDKADADAQAKADVEKKSTSSTETTASTSEDDYFDFLDNEGDMAFNYVKPLTSQADGFKEWQSSVSRDRFSDEYSLQRYPDQTWSTLGDMSIPEWFPESYAKYKQALSGSKTSIVNPRSGLSTPSTISQEEYAQARLRAETDAMMNYTPPAWLNKVNAPFSIDDVFNELADQDWLLPDKKEILTKYFKDQKSLGANDRTSTKRKVAWDAAKEALFKGVDPDKVFKELGTLANKSASQWEAIEFVTSYVESKQKGPQDVFKALSNEHVIETYEEFNGDLELARQQDPDAFSEMYDFLPLSDKLSYMHGLQKSGAITKEQYEGLYVQEVNNNYDPVENPEAPKFIQVEGKLYLDKSGSNETRPKYDLYDTQFYPESDTPADIASFHTTMARNANIDGGQTNDFEGSSWDVWDKIISVASFIPGVGPALAAGYTAIKGASGETLHASDWLRIVPAAVDLVNYSVGRQPAVGGGTTRGPATITLPKVGDIIPGLPSVLAEMDILTILIGGKEVSEGNDSINIGDLITVATAATANDDAPTFEQIAQDTDINGVAKKGSKTDTYRQRQKIQAGIINNFTQQMDAQGYPMPDGGFQTNNQGGFISANGQTVDFRGAYKAVLDFYRNEDPVAFAKDITAEDVDPSIASIVGEDTLGVANFLVNMEDTPKAFENTAYGDFMDNASSFIVAGVLQAGGNILTQLNGVLTLGETYPENTDIAKMSQALLDMSDESKSDSLNESVATLQKFQNSFEDEVYFEAKSREDIINSNNYKTMANSLAPAVANGSITPERRDKLLENMVEKGLRSPNTYNSLANGTAKFFGGLSEAPQAALFELSTELAEEGFNFWVSSKVGLAASGVLKTNAALGRRIDVKDLTEDVLQSIKKTQKWTTLTASTAMDIAEAVGGSAAEAYNDSVATQEKVETLAIQNSESYKAHIKATSKLVQDGTMTEDQFRESAKTYTLEKLNANDGELRRNTVAANISYKVGLAGGAAAVAAQLSIGDAFDKKVFTEIMGKNASSLKKVGEGISNKAAKWATKTGKEVKEWFSAIVKEGVSEAGEEGGVSAYKNTLLHEIDPTIDVVKESIGDTWYGGFMGVTTSASIATAVALNNVGINTDKDANGNFPDWMTSANGTDWMESYGKPEGYVNTNSTNIAANALANLNPAINEALQTNPDGTAVLTEQGIKDVFSSAGLDPTAYPRSYATLMNHVYDDNYTSPDEATTAFSEQGYTPTEAEIDTYIGDTYGDPTLGAAIDTYVDPRMITSSEVETFARENGINLTPDQIASLTKQYANPQDITTIMGEYDSDGDGIPNALDDDPNDPEPTPEPVVEPTPEPVVEPTPEPVVDPQIEADRLAAEAAAQAEADRLAAEEAAAQAEADRLSAEEAAQAEADRLAEEAAAQAEADRLAQIEADRLAAEEEAARLAEEARLAQEEADRLAEEARLADVADREAAQEEARLAAAEAARLAEEAAVARDAIATGDRDAIKDDVAGVKDDVADVKTELGDVEASILAEMRKNEAAGMGRDEALAKAIDDVSGELGTTKDALLAEIGTTEETLRDEFKSGIADSEASILAEMEKNEAAGMGRDEALGKAIDSVANDLGTTKEDILAKIGKTEAELTTKFETGIAEVGNEIQVVADFVGKPASAVTEADIDFFADVLAQQEAMADPTIFVPTEQQLQYDVNNDGILDIKDQAMLEQAAAEQEVALGGKFAPTGLYAQNADIAAQQKQEQDAQFEQEQELARDRQLEMQTNINTNTNTQIEANRARQQQERGQERLTQDLLAYTPQTATTNQMGVADIDYLYDIGGDSIFAPTNRTNLFSPYGDSNVVPVNQNQNQNQNNVRRAAQGGLLRRNDSLLKLLGEN